MSTPRLDYHALATHAARAGAQFSHAAGSTLDKRLRELVNLRISQVNGCAFCIDMHWAHLLKQGMDPRHVNAVAGWRDPENWKRKPLYTDEAQLRWRPPTPCEAEDAIAACGEWARWWHRCIGLRRDRHLIFTAYSADTIWGWGRAVNASAGESRMRKRDPNVKKSNRWHRTKVKRRYYRGKKEKEANE